jgi:hypothetical protein
MIEKICWTVLGLIHLPPALALFLPAMLTRLYGVEKGSTTFTLMHHRAALFVVIFVICLWAIFRTDVRPLALVTVGLSMVSFLVIWAMAGAPAQLRSIAVADIIGIPFLLTAAWMALRSAT